MLKKIALALAVVLAVFALYVTTRPSSFRVERSVVVPADPAFTYAQVADFHRWDAWSPWAKLDPDMKVEYGGPASGVGATYAWKGNDKAGQGKMTITSVTPDREVDVRVDFVKPWEQTNAMRFTFAPEGVGTRVTWTLTGDFDFVGKAFAVFMSIDRAVGPDFERGLAALQRVASARPAAPSGEAQPATSPSP